MMIDDLMRNPTPLSLQWLDDVRQEAIAAREAGVDPDDYEGLTPHADRCSTGFVMSEAKQLVLDLGVDDWDIAEVCDPDLHRADRAELQLYMLAHVLLPEYMTREEAANG